jgi:hypothetical protein
MFRPIDAFLLFVLGPALLIWFAIRSRQLRKRPLLAVPVYRLHVSPRRLIVVMVILFVLGFLLVTFVLPEPE